MNTNSRRVFGGFTLIELLVTLAIIAIISAVVVPNFIGSQLKAKDDNAVARGSVLDLAKTSYLQEQGDNARLAWAALDVLSGFTENQVNPSAKSQRDERKYDLLRPYLSTPPDELGYGTGKDGNVVEEQYTPLGYYYILGSIDGYTKRYRRDGTLLSGGGEGANTVTLTVVANPSNGGTVAPATKSLQSGDSTDISTTGNKGFTFTGWTISGSGSIANSNAFSTSVTLTGSATVTAHYQVSNAEQYDFYIEAGPGGTVSPSGVQWLTATNGKATTPTATASPDTANGYTFDRWSDGTTDNPHAPFQISSGGYVLTATFKPSTLNVNVNIVGNGQVNGRGSYIYKVQKGNSISLFAQPDVSNQFDGWSVDGGATDTTNPLEISNIQSDKTVTATFSTAPIAQYTVTVDSTDANMGSATVNGALTATVNAGTSVNLVATPAGTDYKFLGWSGGAGGSFSANNSHTNPTTYTVNANTTIIADFFKPGGGTIGGSPTDPLASDSLFGFPANMSGLIKGVQNGEVYVLLPGSYDGTFIYPNTTTMYVYDLETKYLKRKINYVGNPQAGTGEMCLDRACSHMYSLENAGVWYASLRVYNPYTGSTSWTTGAFEAGYWAAANGNVLSVSNNGDYFLAGSSMQWDGYFYLWSRTTASAANVVTYGGWYTGGNSYGTIIQRLNIAPIYANDYGSSLFTPLNRGARTLDDKYVITWTGKATDVYGTYYDPAYAMTNYHPSMILAKIGFQTSSTSEIKTLDGGAYPTASVGVSANNSFGPSIHLSSKSLLYLSYNKNNIGWVTDVFSYPGLDFLYTIDDNGSLWTSPDGNLLYILGKNGKINTYTTQFNITVKTQTANSAAGSVAPAEQTVAIGDTVTIVATPSAPTGTSGYSFKEWWNIEDNKQASTSTTYSFQAFGSRTYEARWNASYLVEAGSEDQTKGTVSPTSQWVISGQKATITATPASDKQLHYWAEMPAGTAVEYWSTTFQPTITEAKTYRAFFTNKFTLTAAVNNGAMGSVSPASSSVRYADSTTLTATPNVGFRILQWVNTTGGGSTVVSGRTSTYAVTNLTADASYRVDFEVWPSYAMTGQGGAASSYPFAVNAAYGSVSFSANPVYEGNSVTVTAVPAAGHTFAFWCDAAGSPLTAWGTIPSGSYKCYQSSVTFDNITAAQTYRAKFY